MSKQDNDLFAPCVGKERELKRARDRAEALRAEIEKANEAEAKALAGEPSTDAVKKAREDLAAARAIGQLTGEELRKSTAELLALEQAAGKAQAIAQAASDVRAGLERLLQIAEEDIRRLNDERRELLDGALCVHAERIGNKYMEAAREVHKLFLQLMALDSLASRMNGSTTRFLGPAVHEYCIPCFNFTGHQQSETLAGRAVYRLHDWGGTQAADKQMREAVDTETERLRALGLEIYF